MKKAKAKPIRKKLPPAHIMSIAKQDALIHKGADERCGREWLTSGCQCNACKIARQFNLVPILSDDNIYKMLATHRWCYTIAEDQDPAAHNGYVPSLVVENESGHYPMLGKGTQRAWVWGKTLEEARIVCTDVNKNLGYTEKEAWKIIASTFGKVSREG